MTLLYFSITRNRLRRQKPELPCYKILFFLKSNLGLRDSSICMLKQKCGDLKDDDEGGGDKEINGIFSKIIPKEKMKQRSGVKKVIQKIPKIEKRASFWIIKS